jgi:hypothetical protein
LRAGQRRQQLDRGQLRGLGEHRGQHAQPQLRAGWRALREALECVAQQAHAAHGDERDQHIDAIGRGYFARELAAQVRLGAIAREQGAGGERRVRALVGRCAVNRAQLRARRLHALFGLQGFEQAIDERHLRAGLVFPAHRIEHALHFRRQMPRQRHV